MRTNAFKTAGQFAGEFAGNVQLVANLNPNSKITDLNLVIEGHSFLDPAVILGAYLADKVNATSYYNSAVSGSKIEDVEARASTVDSKLTSETSTLKNVMALWIGVNSNTTWTETYEPVKSYVQDREAAGWTVFVFTMTLTTSMVGNPTLEADRNGFNNLLRTDLPSSTAIICDTDTVDEIDDPSDTDYYSDGIHFTDLGRKYASDLFATVFETVYPNAVSRVDFDLEIDLTITSTGDGSAIAYTPIKSNEITYLSLDGNGKFYYDSLATVGATGVLALLPNKSRTIYVKCSSGVSNLKIRDTGITEITRWIASANAPSIGGDASQLSDITYIRVEGNNTLSGSIAALTGLTYLRVTSNNTLSGSIAALTSLTFLQVSGNNTLSGSISALTGLTYLYVNGSNSLSGSITNLTSLTFVYVVSPTSRISGDINPIVSGLSSCVLNQNALAEYTAGATWANTTLTLRMAVGYGLSTTNMTDILMDISDSSGGISGKTIFISNLDGTVPLVDTSQGGIWGDYSGADAPSSLAIAYKNLIKSRLNIISVDGIVVPGASGDGSGFPDGFGDWYRI